VSWGSVPAEDGCNVLCIRATVIRDRELCKDI
jgi:hypothetical protein